MHLNWFDYVIIGVIVLSLLVSLLRGFLRETISLATWILGIFVAIRFYQQASVWFQGFIDSPNLRNVIAFIVLFLGVFILGLIVGIIVKKGVEITGFSVADKLLGAVFGFIRGVLLVAIVLIFISMTKFVDSDTVTASKISPTFKPLTTWLTHFFPDQLNQLKHWMASSNNQSDKLDKSDNPEQNQDQNNSVNQTQPEN